MVSVSYGLIPSIAVSLFKVSNAWNRHTAADQLPSGEGPLFSDAVEKQT